jgi:hypothetical protein
MKQFKVQTDLSSRITGPHKESPIQDAHTRKCAQIAQPPEMFVLSLTARPVIGISGTVKLLGLINYIYRMLYYSQTAIYAYNVSKFILPITNRDYFSTDCAFECKL